MNLLNFSSTFPDEESCKIRWKAFRDKQGVVCPIVAVKSIIGNQTKKYMSVSSANTVKA